MLIYQETLTVTFISAIGGVLHLSVCPEDYKMFSHNDGIQFLDWIDRNLLDRNMGDVIDGNPIPFQLLGTLTGVCRDARKALSEKRNFVLSVDCRYEARSTAGPYVVRAQVQMEQLPLVVVLD
jgi:hypothetical protein